MPTMKQAVNEFVTLTARPCSSCSRCQMADIRAPAFSWPVMNSWYCLFPRQPRRQPRPPPSGQARCGPSNAIGQPSGPAGSPLPVHRDLGHIDHVGRSPRHRPLVPDHDIPPAGTGVADLESKAQVTQHRLRPRARCGTFSR